MKELMIKVNDLVEVQNSIYLPLNKSKGVVLQVFPYLKMAIVSFPLEVKHYEADVDETYTYDKWFLPYEHLKVLTDEHTAFLEEYVQAQDEYISVMKEGKEISNLLIAEQRRVILELLQTIEELKKDGNEPQYL